MKKFFLNELDMFKNAYRNDIRMRVAIATLIAWQIVNLAEFLTSDATQAAIMTACI